MCPIQRVSHTKIKIKKHVLEGKVGKEQNKERQQNNKKNTSWTLGRPQSPKFSRTESLSVLMCLCVFPNLEPPRFPEHSTTCVFSLSFLHLQILQCETCGSWIRPFAWNGIRQLECLWSLIVCLCMSMDSFALIASIFSRLAVLLKILSSKKSSCLSEEHLFQEAVFSSNKNLSWTVCSLPFKKLEHVWGSDGKKTTLGP